MASIVKWHQVQYLPAVKKLRQKEVIKKDDVVVGILTGRQKDPQLIVDYHLNSNNRFANPPCRA